MVKISDTTITYDSYSYTCKVDYIQREHRFRLTLPDELKALFNVEFLYGNTEEEAEQAGKKMLTSFFDSKKTPAEKIIAYDFTANLLIKNPNNNYVITKIDGGHFGSSPSVSFQYSVGYRQEIPNPRNLSETTTIYFKYDENDRRDYWSPEETRIPWSQSIEDFFEAFTKYLENSILNMFTFLDQPYKKLRESVDTLGPQKALPLLTEKRDMPFFPVHEHNHCPKCNNMRMEYVNLKGETEIRCRTCGTVEQGHPDEYIIERLRGLNLITKRTQEN